MNKVILVGNIGKDAETVGKKTTFSLATSESWVTEGVKQEKTTWHNIVMWNAPPKLVPYLTKGTKIVVDGKIDNYSYEKDGETKYGSAVETRQVEFVGGTGGGSKSQVADATPPADDDIPF